MIFVATCDEVEFLETLFQNVTLYPASERNDEDEEPQKYNLLKKYLTQIS